MMIPSKLFCVFWRNSVTGISHTWRNSKPIITRSSITWYTNTIQQMKGLTLSRLSFIDFHTAYVRDCKTQLLILALFPVCYSATMLVSYLLMPCFPLRAWGGVGVLCVCVCVWGGGGIKGIGVCYRYAQFVAIPMSWYDQIALPRYDEVTITDDVHSTFSNVYTKGLWRAHYNCHDASVVLANFLLLYFRSVFILFAITYWGLCEPNDPHFANDILKSNFLNGTHFVLNKVSLEIYSYCSLANWSALVQVMALY